MYPQMNVYVDAAEEPTVVEPLTVDMEVAEALYPSGNVTENGLRLVVAYCHIEGKEPKNVAEVRAWARSRKVRVSLGREPDPTQSEASDA
jgi:hypothetical protein